MKVLLFMMAFGWATGYAQSDKDSVAIVGLLEKESATWRAGDAKAHADCWAVKPYSRILISIGDSTVLDIPRNTCLTRRWA